MEFQTKCISPKKTDPGAVSENFLWFYVGSVSKLQTIDGPMSTMTNIHRVLVHLNNPLSPSVPLHLTGKGAGPAFVDQVCVALHWRTCSLIFTFFLLCCGLSPHSQWRDFYTCTDARERAGTVRCPKKWQQKNICGIRRHFFLTLNSSVLCHQVVAFSSIMLPEK